MSIGRTRRLGLLVAAIFASGVLVACGGAQSRLADHLERGKTLLADGSLKKAGVEFRNALQIDPRNVEAQLLNGRVAERLGDVRDAAIAYQTVIELQPGGADGPAALGRLFVFAGAPDRALALVAPALAQHPGHADLLTVRGAARAQQKDIAGALEDAQAAVTAAPANENAVALLASIYRQQQQLPQALALIAQAVQANPRSVDLRQILASLAGEAGDTATAEAQLRQVVALRPADMAHRTRLALFYARLKRIDDAQGVLVQAAKDLPDSNDAKLQLVDFIATQRSRAKGEKTLRDFIARDPDNQELKLGLGGLFQRVKADADALAVYREIVNTWGNSPAALIARNRIASIQVAARQYDAGRATVDETLKLNPRDNDALTLRAGLALERHEAAAAIADLRSVLRENPQSVSIRRTLARAHIENQEPVLAEDVLREAMQIDPHDRELRLDLAQLLSQTNRAAQAVTLLEETVRQAPADVAAREMLVRAYLSTNDVAAARTAAQDLQTLQPEGVSGHYLAGLAAEAGGKLDDAQQQFSRALELSPGATDALAAYAQLQIRRGKPDDALARVRVALEHDPRDARARNLLGEVLVVRKSYAEAIDAFSAATRDAPGWAVPYRNIAQAKFAQRDPAGATVAYERALEPTGYAVEIVGDLAALYEKGGKPDEAIALYDKLHEREPLMAFAVNNLAMLLVTYRTDRPSLARARALTEPFAKSDSGSLLDTSGWVRFKLGENQDALELLQRAAGRSPASSVFISPWRSCRRVSPTRRGSISKRRSRATCNSPNSKRRATPSTP